MLSVLEGEGLTDVCAVVTRYFGGTLLGSGGLVRAYAAAVRKGLESCTILTAMPALKVELEVPYGGAGKLKHFFEGKGIPLLNVAYTDRVAITILVPEEEKEELLAQMDDLTGGRMRGCGMEAVYYGNLEGKVVLL